MDEIVRDKEVGQGKSSFLKVSESLDFGPPCRTIICQKCHLSYTYDKATHNICPNKICENNPTFYSESEPGPYRCYNFPEKPPNTVIIREQEPIGLNPSGRNNLLKLHTELKKYWPPECKSFPFYGDGLPAVSFERIKCDSVDCVTHSVNIPLKDTKLMAQHCTEECILDWPLKDLYVLYGMSHEEIAMNVVALTSNVHFGVLDMLSALGRHNRSSQLQAIRSKRLHTLFELNYIYTKAAFVATAVPFLNYCDTSQVQPTVQNLYKFVSDSPNLEYQARFRIIIALNLPCIVKRIGIRLDNEEISCGGSALFMPAAYATNMSWYRDYYHFRYMNGRFSPSLEALEPKKADLEEFLDKVDPELKNNISSRPHFKQYPVKHPSENVKFGVYRAKYAHLTESRTRVDSHEGGDFIQENNLGHVIPYLKKGKIFSQEIFCQAVRMFQYSKDKKREYENEAHIEKKEVIRKRPKYEIEIQAVAAQIIYKSEDPSVPVGLGDLHEDILRITEIGRKNYRDYFLSRINAVSGGKIKLKPAFFTKEASSEYEKLENQTKNEMILKIKNLITGIHFDDPQEKLYYEIKANKTNLKKCELVDLYRELHDMLVIQNNIVDFTEVAD